MTPNTPSKFACILTRKLAKCRGNAPTPGTDAYDTLLHEVRNAVRKSKPTPSELLWSEYDFDDLFHYEQGRHPRPSALVYNISTDALRAFTHANGILTDDAYRKYQSGFSKKQAPRKALLLCAGAIGFRMIRGYRAISCKLHGTELEQFNGERVKFVESFCLIADSAHAQLANTDASTRALAAVGMCFDEAHALAGWLRRVGQHHDAAMMITPLTRVIS